MDMAKKDWMSRIPKLTLEEMKKMIFSLTEEILPVMEVAEKQAFIIKLLGKSGNDKLSSMASRWIAECMDEGVDPKDMCRRVVTSIDEHAELESLANPEIRALFADWMEELESEVLSLYRERKRLGTEDLRAHFKISRQGAEFLLEKLRKEGKID